MYYPQQSPGIAHKLAGHHEQNPWSRHPVLGPPGTQPPVGPQPTSPGYPLFTNGAVTSMQHHPAHMQHQMAHPPLQHHHQNSLSHFPSPPGNGQTHQQHVLSQGSPANVSGTLMTTHWQQQLIKYDAVIRGARSPHHRARQNVLASRTVTKSAVAITNPNLVKPPVEPADKDDPDLSDSSPMRQAAILHPSNSTGLAGDARPIALEAPKNNWNSLDMGGVSIKNIPRTSGLFSFTFLINLYLNHNSLTVIPPEISQLRHLEHLDVSGNNLTSLPPEIGMITSLKELFFFDNHIATLPYELGSLHQLQTLGLEGNPLDPSLKNIIQTQGTHTLIAHIRDSTPRRPPPPPRPWKDAISPQEREAFLAEPNSEIFTLLCYNILCERAATERLYGYTPKWALDWDQRKDVILNELLEHDVDFLCLQEVDIAQYENFFSPRLEEMGYDGIHYPKSRYKTMSDPDRRQVDGLATFFKRDKYQLVESHLIEFNAMAMQRQDFKKTDDMFNRVLGKDHIGTVCLLEQRVTGTRLVLANIHTLWDPAFCDVKLVQVALLLEEVEKIVDEFARYPPRPPQTPDAENSEGFANPSRPPPNYTDGSKIPLIVCGDFNSLPESSVYEFLSTGGIPAKHPDFLGHMYGKYTSEGLQHHLGLKSAYAWPGGELMPMTNFTPGFQETIDYIWYSTANLAVNRVIGEINPEYLEKVVGFPSQHYPSDHISILSEFRVKPPRDAPPRQVSGHS